MLKLMPARYILNTQIFERRNLHRAFHVDFPNQAQEPRPTITKQA